MAEASNPPATEQLDIDPNFQNEDDGDSAYGSNLLSTTSLTSSILEYRKLHGRTYQNFGDVEYWAPNDDRQNEQLDINHHMLSLALDNKLFVAPIDAKAKSLKVLDLGTGTGMWAMDFADEFPDSEVIGTDVSPTQPNWVPPNCVFELDDASKTWTFPDNTFDYIHIRYMIGCFKDWPAVYKECLRCLKPGGWLEHMDCSSLVQSDDPGPKDPIWKEWSAIFDHVQEATGNNFNLIDNFEIAKFMEEAGFTNIQKKLVKVPIGGWPAQQKWKDVGLYNKLGIETGLEGFALFALTTIMGWQYEQVQLLLARVRASLNDKKQHNYNPWGIAWAQKPKA
ncbi:S-adenosyl-L-methionine-dependent methyltransferase [Echria macrotheca]|uniref:S-adenosyl-L-methionine-dependent methyltransferase n=1 Tax=Echria macrotheca TaxID=438768 RepID=A0AAJ0BH01_9PEZI|nr:S-adenosyl-L-methionine-dependent methyltransferase [Echria macrotheca]